MDNKKVLISLLDFIKKSTDFKSDKDISVKAGYHFSYISQRISKDEVSEKLIDKVKLTFANEIKKWETPTDDNNNVIMEEQAQYKRRIPINDKMFVRDSMARIIESQLRMEARLTITRNFIAEVYGKVCDTSVSKVLTEMDEMEKLAAQQLQDLLRQQ